jgi:hypothetical protein
MIVGPRLLAILAVLAATSVAVAVGVRSAAIVAAPSIATELAFPAVAADPGAVATIALRRAGETTTLTLGEDGKWTMAETGGYPVRPGLVDGFLGQLGGLRIKGPRTARPRLYPLLGVEDAGPDAAAVSLVLRDGAGRDIAAMLLGRPGGDRADPGLYLRRPGEAQSWLADGTLDLPRGHIDWLDPALLDIPADRIAALSVEQPGRPPLLIARDGTGAFRIADLPFGIAVNERRMAGITDGLAGLALVDVRRSDAADREIRRLTFRTRDGLAVVLRVVAAAGADPGGSRVEVAVAAERPEAAVEAVRLAARFDGWAYRLPQARMDLFAVELGDLAAPR